jgi:hypothetical protein
VGAPVVAQVGDADERQVVARGERFERGAAGHRAVLGHDLADHPGRRQPGQSRQIDRRLGLPPALQHPAVAGTQWEDMTGGDQVGGVAGRVDQRGDRAGAVGRGDAGRHAPPRLHREGEGAAEAGAVARGRHHQRQAEPVEACAGQRDADQPTPLARHEVDRRRRGEVRGDDQIALVLAVLVVHDDDETAGL